MGDKISSLIGGDERTKSKKMSGMIATQYNYGGLSLTQQLTTLSDTSFYLLLTSSMIHHRMIEISLWLTEGPMSICNPITVTRVGVRIMKIRTPQPPLLPHKHFQNM